MSVIQLDVGPGIVSATYFVIFDLFLLAIVDVVLIHVVSWLYYKRIKKGTPLEVRSAEIPGVATSLVGRVYSPPNIVAYAIKIILLICIIVVDGNIDTRFVRSRSQQFLSSTFKFDASNESWPVGMTRIVERRWEEVRRCHVINAERTNVTFYAIAFNLAGNETVDNELVPEELADRQGFKKINESTVQCLAKGRVSNPEAYVMAEVVGCSTLDGSIRCSNETTVTRSFERLQWEPSTQQPISIEEGSGHIGFLIQDYPAEEVASIFPEYHSPTLTCTRTRFGPYGENGRILEACLLVSSTSENNDSNTLIERWEIDRRNNQLVRRFPGPIFKGRVDIGSNVKSANLQNIRISANWVSFSGAIVADGCVYAKRIVTDGTIERIGTSVAKTTVPVYTVVLTAFLILAAIVARVVVAMTISHDDRPQLNTVNGLSSVAREENEPTGRSMTVGRGMVIGLTKRDGRSVHFGPMNSRDVGVARERGAFIE